MSKPRRSCGLANHLPGVPLRAVAARPARALVARAGLLLLAVTLVIGGGALVWGTTTTSPAAQAAPLPAADVSTSLAPEAVGPTSLSTSPSSAPITADTMAPGTILIPSAGIYVHWQAEPVKDGSAVVPTDGTAGMWDAGATPASTAGTVLLWAHVDNGKGGPGPFAGLAQTVPQGAVYVRDQSGALTVWQVTRIYTEARDSTHPDLFSTAGPHRLAVVTCGGAVTAAHYTRNVIIIATPEDHS